MEFTALLFFANIALAMIFQIKDAICYKRHSWEKISLELKKKIVWN